MRDFIADSNDKCKKGTAVLHRNPRREWAGDMPKGVKVNASHRNLDDFLTSRSAQLKNAGISKTRMKAAISGEMAKRGGKASDFASLTGAEQDSLFKKLRNSIDAKLPSTKKANAGKHAKKPTTIDRSAPVYSKLESKHINKIAEIIEKADNPSVRVYAKYENHLTLIDEKSHNADYFSPDNLGVYLNLAKTFSDKKRPSMNSWFHEFGHHIDYLATGDGSWAIKKARTGMSRRDAYASMAYKSGLFPKTILKEVDELIKTKESSLWLEYRKAMKSFDIDTLYKLGYIQNRAHRDELKEMVSNFGNHEFFKKKRLGKYGATLEGHHIATYRRMAKYVEKPTWKQAVKEVESEVKALKDTEKCDLSDILEGATYGDIQAGWGHIRKNPNYWNAESLAHEAFAEIFSAYINNPDSLTTIKRYLPKTVGVFDDIIKAIEGGSLT